MPRIFLTRRIPDSGIEKIKEFTSDYSIFPHDRPIKEEELIENLGDVEGLLCLLTDPVTKDVIDAGRTLRVIANYAVGYDNIDVRYATQKGIIVTNTPGVLTDATAELGWALLFACARRIVEADRYTRDGKFSGWSPTLLLGREFLEKTLGIIGAGRIGTAFALKGIGFGLKILYYDKHVNKVLEEKVGASRTDLNRLLKQSDFISIHVPLNKGTYHLIGERELSFLKPTAYLINTSRGPIIDEEALIRFLRERRIGGAGLDVYESEPKIPKELLDLNNVVVLPHIGSATREARDRMAEMAVENLVSGLEGKTPPNKVN